MGAPVLPGAFYFSGLSALQERIALPAPWFSAESTFLIQSLERCNQVLTTLPSSKYRWAAKSKVSRMVLSMSVFLYTWQGIPQVPQH